MSICLEFFFFPFSNSDGLEVVFSIPRSSAEASHTPPFFVWRVDANDVDDGSTVIMWLTDRHTLSFRYFRSFYFFEPSLD